MNLIILLGIELAIKVPNNTQALYGQYNSTPGGAVMKYQHVGAYLPR